MGNTILFTCALMSEARPIVDWYKLIRISDDRFRIFSNDQITLIVSGIGELNSAIATSYAVGKFNGFDYFFNIGICGAINSYKLGELIVPYKIISSTSGQSFYPEIRLKGEFSEGILGTFSAPVTKLSPSIDFYDMEAAGFYEAAIKFQNSSRIYSLKVVSDHLTNLEMISKELVEDLIRNRVSSINIFIESLKKCEFRDINTLTIGEKDDLAQIAEQALLTTTQCLKLYSLAKAFKIRGEDWQVIEKLKYTGNTTKDRNEWFKGIEALLTSF